MISTVNLVTCSLFTPDSAWSIWCRACVCTLLWSHQIVTDRKREKKHSILKFQHFFEKTFKIFIFQMIYTTWTYSFLTIFSLNKESQKNFIFQIQTYSSQGIYVYIFYYYFKLEFILGENLWFARCLMLHVR